LLTYNLADIRGRQNQMTPLHAAAWSGRVEVAKLLVEAKADIDAGDKVCNSTTE
jgi:ankyrin repeat protein